MAELYDLEYSTAFYRSKDNFKNFRIKVSLNKGSTLGLVTQTNADQQEQPSDIHAERLKQLGTQDNEEYVFSWQEKLFSRREYETYLNEENCVTSVEKLYNDTCKKIQQTDGNRPNIRLFTFVDHDSYTPIEQNSSFVQPVPSEEPYLADKMRNVRYHQNSALRNRNHVSAAVTRASIVDYQPSDEHKKQTHYTSSALKTMYIMVDLNPMEDAVPSPANEVVLCTIKQYPNDVFSVCPDFNSSQRAYKVDCEGALVSELFEFHLHHVSKEQTFQEKDRERKVIEGLIQRHEDFISAQVGHEFEMTPADALRVVIYGEIKYAFDFEDNDLYIQYLVELPEGWYAPFPEQIFGTSHSSRCKYEGQRSIFNMSFPFELELLYQKDPYKNIDPNRAVPEWPVILFEVLSLDGSYRHRVEGYTYVHLPIAPGTSRRRLSCWRPRGNSTVCELRRFFIGGSPELEDISYAAKPSSFSGERISRFGFKTISTGSIDVQFNCMQQSQLFSYSSASKKKVGTVIHKADFSKRAQDILGVVEAFRRAKQKMVAAREHLKKDFTETLRATEVDD